VACCHARAPAQELAGNQIAELGEGVLAGLTAVHDLDLSGNALARLGDGLAAMPALVALALERNRLDALPASLGGCAALTRLDVSHNQLRALPVRGVRGLQLRARPKHAGRAGVIAGFSTPGVSGCSCIPWPETARRARAAQASLAGLPKLQRLLCTNNRLATIPPAFGHMRHLKEFSLRRAPPHPMGFGLYGLLTGQATAIGCLVLETGHPGATSRRRGRGCM